MFTLWALFFFAFSTQAQNEETKLVDKKAKELSVHYTSNTNFSKTLLYYKKENWDSVLIYSTKTIGLTKKELILDYSHYYRALALKHKGLFPHSLTEFSKVRPSFPYHFLTQLQIAGIYLEQEKFNEALDNYMLIDTNNSIHRQNINIDALLHNKGICYFHLGKYDLAEQHLLKAIQKIQKRKDRKSLIYSYMDLANVYYEQYQDEKAIEYFTKAYELSLSHGDFQIKQNAAINMAAVEENRKNFEKSIQYRKEYESWRDSLNDQNKIYEVAELEKKFAVDQKQKEVKLLETENQLKQTRLNMYLFAALLLFAILVFGTYLYRQNVKRSKIILKQKQELDVLNATKDQLFSIVSHDLRSSVHALRSSNTELRDNLESKHYDKLDSKLEQNSAIATNTYNLLDNLLHWAQLQTKGGYFHQEEHRLSMLVDQVAFNFQALLKLKEIEFKNAIPKSQKIFIDAESIKIVLRNFMDNSIKFSNPNALITVSILSETEKQIKLCWEDNGKGMSEETRLKLLSDGQELARKDHEKELGSGLGMRLCKSMVEKNGGKINILSQVDVGTKMIVTLYKSALDGTY